MSEQCRVTFNTELKNTGCSVFEGSKYEEILQILRGNTGGMDPAPSATAMRRTKRNFAIIQKDGKEWLIRQSRLRVGDQRPLVSSDDLFDIILSVYTRLGRCSANKLSVNISQKYVNIPKDICSIFISCYVRDNVGRLTREGSLSLIDMRDLPCKGKQWILIYQEHPSKKLYARELESNAYVTVANSLLRIFIVDGAPESLESNFGNHYTRFLLSWITRLDDGYSNIMCSSSHYRRFHRQSFKRFKHLLDERLRSDPGGNWPLQIYYVTADINKEQCNPIPMDRLWLHRPAEEVEAESEEPSEDNLHMAVDSDCGLPVAYGDNSLIAAQQILELGRSLSSSTAGAYHQSCFGISLVMSTTGIENIVPQGDTAESSDFVVLETETDAIAPPSDTNFPASGRVIPDVTVSEEIRRLRLVVTPTRGEGECLFYATCDHLSLHRGHNMDPKQLRRAMVEFIQQDRVCQEFFQSWMSGDVDITKLYECDVNDQTTWPPPEVCFALSQMLRLKITIFLSLKPRKGFPSQCQIMEYWPSNQTSPEYPPMPSSDHMCLKYSEQRVHFELLLNKEHFRTLRTFRTPDRPTTTSKSLATKASKRPRQSYSEFCRCKGYCATKSCSCNRMGRECTSACHPGNEKCDNHFEE